MKYIFNLINKPTECPICKQILQLENYLYKCEKCKQVYTINEINKHFKQRKGVWL